MFVCQSPARPGLGSAGPRRKVRGRWNGVDAGEPM
jgi:hypothetical protein